MKAYESMQFIGFLLFISGLFGFLLGLTAPNNDAILSPIVFAMGVIFATAGTFRSKRYCNRILYMVIVAVALAVMLIGEYLFAPAQNRLIFFAFVVVFAIAFFVLSYFLLTPEKSRTGKEKILYWFASILFGLSFYGILAIVYNNFTVALILGVLVVVIIVISRLIRRRKIPKAPN